VNQLGYFGKTQHRGDFVRFNLPQSFTKVWDDWLQQIILDGEQYHQSEWKTLYDKAPAHHFVFSSGIAGSQMWIGILLPSQDKVGRRFPFCLAMSLPEYNLPCVAAAQLAPWFVDAQNLLSRMQTSDFDFDQLQAELGHLAEKYEQNEIPSSSPLASMPNLHSDAIGVTVDSAMPLNNPVATQALLDGLLTQTLGEYSLWMCQDGSNQSLLHSGLPVGQSALAMFRGDMQTCATTRVEIASLGLSASALAPLDMPISESHQAVTGDENLANAQPSGLPDALPNVLADAPAGASIAALHGDDLTDTNMQVSNADEISTLSANPLSADPVPDSAGSQDDLNATNEYQPLDASTIEQIPSADDWAALDEFKVADDGLVEVTIPEVEPLELDEDESADTEDAPWET